MLLGVGGYHIYGKHENWIARHFRVLMPSSSAHLVRIEVNAPLQIEHFSPGALKPVENVSSTSSGQPYEGKNHHMDANMEQSTGDTKPCPVCAETIKKAALKCRFCNADLREFAEGQQSGTEQTLFHGHPVVIFSVWQWGMVVITLGIAYLVYKVRSLAVTYDITSQRIRVERGLLSTVKDSVELFTIEHFDIHKPLGMRLAGFCILRLRSSDESYSSFSLQGIPQLESIADNLRECSLRERKRRGIMSVIRP